MKIVEQTRRFVLEGEGSQSKASRGWVVLTRYNDVDGTNVYFTIESGCPKYDDLKQFQRYADSLARLAREILQEHGPIADAT